MRKKLALLSFLEGEGPWVKSSGDEIIAEVHGLHKDEELSLEVKGMVGAQHLTLGENSIDFLAPGQFYRFTKKVPEGLKPSKTSVEVILNGSSSSKPDAGGDSGSVHR